MDKKSNKTIAIIQARMGSTRLRGKSLISINGIPLLLHVINSTKKLKFLDNIIVATMFLVVQFFETCLGKEGFRLLVLST